MAGAATIVLRARTTARTSTAKTRVTPFTLAGLPTLNVRAGFNEAGLPMGLQLAGPIHADLEVLRLGHAYDEACGWGSRRPPVLA